MTKNTSVDTAQKGQATTKNNIPTGKVKTLANATERRKAREEQFRNFRINALRRRCKRMGFDEAKTEEYVKKLIEQLNAPKEYDILIMFSIKEGPMMHQALDNAKIKYKFNADTYFFVQGDQNVLAKIREIAPPSAKIYPYARKMESVLKDVERPPQEKKPTNNTVAKRKAAKDARKKENTRKFLNRKKGKGKAIAWGSRKISLAERKKLRKATTVQLNTKKSSTASKKASSETLVPRRRMKKAA